MCKIVLTAFFGVLCALGQDDCAALPAGNNRKVVISDLHLGAGRLNDRTWHPLEDFRFEDTFREFLKQEGANGRTDLIIDGDFIDFWQLLPELDAARPADQGSSEEESIKKVQVALKGHPKVFTDLAAFGRIGNNRVILIPGNHDVDIQWPGVQSRIAGAIGLPLNQKLIFAIPCLEVDGIHIEHGHQRDVANRFPHPAAPFTTAAAVKRLETNWGTTFMSRFYNKLEEARPFIDNLYPEVSTAVWAFEKEPRELHTAALFTSCGNAGPGREGLGQPLTVRADAGQWR